MDQAMQLRSLGSTGIRISVLSFGAGPVSALMTGTDTKRQLQVVRRALEAGINWFDTAAGYGEGQSERNLGAALRRLGADSDVHVATKVRLLPPQLDDIRQAVRDSVTDSLERLGLERVTLLQLHNAITARRGDEPTSITPNDILDTGGVLQAFQDLQSDGLVEHLGLTGIGRPEALSEVIRSGEFATIQVPYNLMNPSAGQSVPADFGEADYGNVIGEGARLQMGVLAIRVYAGGALAGRPPGPHTYKTKFFPIDLYRRDQERVTRLQELLPEHMDPKEAAVRFVLSHPDVASAIIGFGDSSHVDEAKGYAAEGPLPTDIRMLP